MKKGKIIFLFLVSIFTFSITKNVFAEESCPPITLSYYIMFNTNGGEAVSDFSFTGAPQGYTGETLPTTTKTGYTFNGWYKETGFTTKITTTVDAQANLDFQVIKDSDNCDTGRRKATVYAKWTAKTYTISFDANGGTGGQSANVTATYGSAMPTISTTAPTKSGYTFKGWYDAASGGTQYYTAAGTSAKNWNKTSNTKLYAQWDSNSPGSNDGCVTMITGAIHYTISFETNGGSSVADIEQTYSLGQAGGEGLEMPKFPTKEGYSFKGWYAEKTFKNEITNFEEDWDKISFQSVKVGDCVKPEKTATLYAKWEKENETNRYGTFLVLLLDDNNKKFIRLNDEVVKDISAVYDKLKTIELTTPEKDGYTFDGWYVDKEYKTKVSSGDDIVNVIKEKGMIDMEGHAELFGYANYMDLKLYAKWNQTAKIGNTGVSQSMLFTIVGGLMILAGSTLICKKRKVNKSSL